MEYSEEREEKTFNVQLERIEDCWHATCATFEETVFFKLFVSGCKTFSVTAYVYTGTLLNGQYRYYPIGVSVKSTELSMSVLGVYYKFKISDFSVLVTTTEDIAEDSPNKKFLYTEDYSSCVQMI